MPGSPDRSLIGLLPHFFRSSVACPTVPWADHSSAYCLVCSARWRLAQRFLGRITHRLTSSFLPLISGFPGSTDRSLIGLLPRFSARQWLAPLARWITHRLTSSFLPLVSGLPGLPDGSLIGLLPRFFHSSVARRTDRSSAYFLLPSAHQLLARRFLGRIARRLTSLFPPLVSSLPNGSSDGSLIGLLPCFFRSSVARRTDRSLAYFLFLPLISGLPSSPNGALIGLLPRFFRSSVACPAR